MDTSSGGDINDSVDKPSGDSLNSPRIFAFDYVRLSETLLTNQVMLYAYAVSIVIVALGFVGLILTLAVLSFFYPEKVQPFMSVLIIVCPMLGILFANIGKIKSAAKKIAANGH